jgi:hypothetical protein
VLVLRFSDCIELRDARNRAIVQARRELHMDGLPRPDAQLWSRFQADSLLRIDTSRWSSWGCLAMQCHQASRTDMFITSRLTEHYLQHLAWSAMLRMLLVGQISAQAAGRKLAKHFSTGERIRFNLSQALAAARHVANEIRAEESSDDPFVTALTGLFSDNRLVAGTGYANLDAIYQERNRHAHRGALTIEEEQRVIDQHQRVIQNILNVLGQGPKVTISSTGRTVDKHGHYTAALLESPNKTMDCGPFLLTRTDHPSTLFIPHQLARAAANPDLTNVKNKPSDYERQDVANREGVDGHPKITIVNPFPEN